jgi:hypothetical protein
MLKQTLTALLVAATPAAALAAEPATEAPKKERKICRMSDETGSRVRPARICHTAAEWRVINARTLAGNGEGNGSPFLQERVETPQPSAGGGPPRF